jgi:hypothetical protein
MFGKFKLTSATPYSIKLGLPASEKSPVTYEETYKQKILTLPSVYLLYTGYISISHSNVCLLDFVPLLVLI